MWDFMNMHGYYGGGFMWLWLLLIILVAILIFMLLFKKSDSIQSNRSEKSALDILEKRFARGEISEDEFKSMKKTLEND